MRHFKNSPSFSIVIHSDAESDLELIWDENEEAASDIVVFLEEAKQNQTTLDNLTRNNYASEGENPYSISEWAGAKKKRLNLWRLKLLWLKGAAAKYRIIYAFNPTEMRYYVLGILKREFNYDLEHPLSKRIISAYDDLELPRI